MLGDMHTCSAQLVACAHGSWEATCSELCKCKHIPRTKAQGCESALQEDAIYTNDWNNANAQDSLQTGFHPCLREQNAQLLTQRSRRTGTSWGRRLQGSAKPRLHWASTSQSQGHPSHSRDSHCPCQWPGQWGRSWLILFTGHSTCSWSATRVYSNNQCVAQWKFTI